LREVGQQRTVDRDHLTGADHAWAFVFLASDRSRGITGETIHPDGGFRLGTTKVERP